jgi:serine/threonine protein kinase
LFILYIQISKLKQLIALFETLLKWKSPRLNKIIFRFQPPKLYKYCYQILFTVEHLHQHSLAHWDITHLNILLNSLNNFKLTDFRLNQQIHSQLASKCSDSNIFIAPEVGNDKSCCNHFLADIYSLGITFYFMRQRKYPFPLICQRMEKRWFSYLMITIHFKIWYVQNWIQNHQEDMLCLSLFKIHCFNK